MENNKNNESIAAEGNPSVETNGVPPGLKTQQGPGAKVQVPPVIDESKNNSSNKKTTVEVDKDVLDNILAKIADLEKKSTEYEKTASQDQIRKIEALRASGHLVKSVKLREFNNKIVIGWKSTKDNVWVADGRLHEVQEMDVFFEDGTKEPTTLLQFTRGVTYKPFEVLKEAKTINGDIEYTVDAGGGKELVVLNKFVN